MRMRLINGNIIVKREEADKKIGSLYVPDNAKDKSTFGRVVDVSPGYYHKTSGKFIEHTVKPGDRVLLSKWLEEVRVGSEDVLVVHQEDILAVVEG